MTGRRNGQTTSTHSRSERNRTSRRGGHRIARARGPSSKPACPSCVLPEAPVPVHRPYGQNRTSASGVIFISRGAVAPRLAHLAIAPLRESGSEGDPSPTRRLVYLKPL